MIVVLGLISIHRDSMRTVKEALNTKWQAVHCTYPPPPPLFLISLSIPSSVHVIIQSFVQFPPSFNSSFFSWILSYDCGCDVVSTVVLSTISSFLSLTTKERSSVKVVSRAETFASSCFSCSSFSFRKASSSSSRSTEAKMRLQKGSYK